MTYYWKNEKIWPLKASMNAYQYPMFHMQWRICPLVLCIIKDLSGKSISPSLRFFGLACFNRAYRVQYCTSQPAYLLDIFHKINLDISSVGIWRDVKILDIFVTHTCYMLVGASSVPSAQHFLLSSAHCWPRYVNRSKGMADTHEFCCFSKCGKVMTNLFLWL